MKIYKRGISLFIIIVMVISLLPTNLVVAQDDIEYDVNLAVNKTVTVSSTSSNESELVASNITDGDTNTRWKSGDNDSGTVTIDLGEVYDFNEVRILWEGAYSTNYTIEVSSDNSSWKTVTNITNMDAGGLKKHQFEMASARYLKMTSTAMTNSFISIFEMEVYKRRVLPSTHIMENIIPNVSSIIGGFIVDNDCYEINVGNETESISLTPVIAGGETVFATVNGETVYSGSASQMISLNVGINPIKVIVADPLDEENKVVYTVNVDRKSYDFNGTEYSNVAVNKPKTAYMEDGSIHTAFWNSLDNVNNGNRDDFAQPNLSNNTPWQVKIDLEDSYIVDRIDYYPFAGQYPYNYIFKTSMNGNTWKDVVTDTNENGASKTYKFEPTTARYIMFSSAAATGYSGISEIEVYGIDFSVQNLANAIKSITVPRGITQIPLPPVTEGYSVSILSSSNTNVVDIDGKITLSKTEQTSNVVLKITDLNSGESANTVPILVTIPRLINIKSVDSIQDVEVESGTSEQTACNQLPTTVDIQLENNETITTDVVWGDSIPAYDSIELGTYKYVGTITLPTGILNENNISLELTANVIVKAAEIGSIDVQPGDLTVTVPASDFVRRKFLAYVKSSKNTIMEGQDVTWSISSNPVGVLFNEITGMLNIDSTAQSGILTITATSKTDISKSSKVTITINKKDSLEDVVPNPLEKEGWVLDFHDEFDQPNLNTDVWYPGYLTHWANTLESSKTNYLLQNGKFILNIDENNEEWSAEDNGNKATGMQSFERNGLHKWGSHVIQRQDVKPFDGYATKYGYYEIRTKLPNIGEGGHIAWWMVGTHDDKPNDATGNQSIENSEIDIIEIPYAQASSSNPSTYPVIHKHKDDNMTQGKLQTYNLDADSSSEYHIFAMDWQPDGMKFYYDNKLVSSTNDSPNYRMMTFFSMYAGGEGYWTGQDNGVYPKDWFIDYFRVYKKDSESMDINIDSLKIDEQVIKCVDGTITYSIDVPKNKETITITPTAKVPEQIIEIENNVIASGTVSQSIELSKDVEKIKIKVTAGNGDYKYYTLTVNRSNDDQGLKDYTVNAKFNMDKLQKNKDLTAEVTVNNNSSEEKTVLVIAALFDSSDRMVNYSYISKKITNGQVESINTGFRLPNNVDNHKVKVMVWDGENIETTNMQPLSNAIELQ